MDVDFSILQLTSLTAIVAAAVFLTWVAKRLLADVPFAAAVPVWAYTIAIAAVLTYVANRITGTLEGEIGVLIVDAIIKAAIASGIREWVVTGTKPLSASGTAQKARDGQAFWGPGAWLLPLVMAAGLALPACGGAARAPVVVAPAEAQIQATRQAAIQIAEGVKQVGRLVDQTVDLTAQAYDAKLITRVQRDVVLRAVVDLEPRAIAVIDVAKTVSSEPELRATVGALIAVSDPLIVYLESSGHLALVNVAKALKSALALARSYLGGV